MSTAAPSIVGARSQRVEPEAAWIPADRLKVLERWVRRLNTRARRLGSWPLAVRVLAREPERLAPGTHTLQAVVVRHRRWGKSQAAILSGCHSTP
jgi:hypothetical protein